tara:strand:- start:126 stop:275 length:150 start_codon:yes stop_codon:yes gene_type:complete
METQDNLIDEYLQQLTEKEHLALNKAKEILGDSFNIKKSLGFIKWLKSK